MIAKGLKKTACESDILILVPAIIANRLSFAYSTSFLCYTALTLAHFFTSARFLEAYNRAITERYSLCLSLSPNGFLSRRLRSLKHRVHRCPPHGRVPVEATATPSR